MYMYLRFQSPSNATYINHQLNHNAAGVPGQKLH